VLPISRLPSSSAEDDDRFMCAACGSHVPRRFVLGSNVSSGYLDLLIDIEVAAFSAEAALGL